MYYVYTSILGCPELEIENGNVTVEMNPAGTNSFIANYSCMDGTMLFGNDTRYCYTSAIAGITIPFPLLEWTGIEPICRGMYVIVTTLAEDIVLPTNSNASALYDSYNASTIPRPIVYENMTHTALTAMEQMY